MSQPLVYGGGESTSPTAAGAYANDWKTSAFMQQQQQQQQQPPQQQASPPMYGAPPGMHPQGRSLQQHQQSLQQQFAAYSPAPLAMSPPPTNGQQQQQQQPYSSNRALLPMQAAQQQPQQMQQQQPGGGQQQRPVQSVQPGGPQPSQQQYNSFVHNLSDKQIAHIMQQMQMNAANGQQQQQTQPQGQGQAQGQAQGQVQQLQGQAQSASFSPHGQNYGPFSQQQSQQQAQYGGAKSMSPHYGSAQAPQPQQQHMSYGGPRGEEMAASANLVSPPPAGSAMFARSSGHLLSPQPPHVQQQQGQQQGQMQQQQGTTDPQSVAQMQIFQRGLLSAMMQQQGSGGGGGGGGNVQQGQQGGNESGGPTPLSRVPSVDDHSLSSASSYPSPLSGVHSLPSPSARSMGFHSNISSTRSHSRSISGVGALNPSAAEFNPTWSNPNSPANAHCQSPGGRFFQPQMQTHHGGGGGGSMQSHGHPHSHGRAASSTPTLGFGAASSASPPSSSSTLSSRDGGGSSGGGGPTQLVVSPVERQQAFEEQLQLLGLPSQPFDAREMDAQICRERPEHAEYIYNFRVTVCQAWLEGACPNDAYTCMQTHARLPRRRRPILQHGRFNYIPTRCRYIIEEKECPQGVHCRFSHVTEEVIYHASKFKTQQCSHPIDKEGRCAGYGAHCAKAHGPQDLRQPVFESTDDSHTAKQPQDLYDYVCPIDKRAIENRFYMYVYKTRKCAGFPFSCDCDGLDYHRSEERRRGPVIRYAPMACPNVKPYLNAEWSRPNVDCSGRFKPKILKNGQLVPQESDEWDCEYAHTLLELMYHPQVYKSATCDHFQLDNPATWRCVWKRRCAHAHGHDDLRTKDEATEEWRNHLMAALPHATSQMPAMLNRLLSVGAAALDSLSNASAGMSKGRTGSSASPSQLSHRRSISSVSMQGGSGGGVGGGGGPIRSGMGQGPSARVAHLSFQPVNVGNSNAYAPSDSSPHSQPITPMMQHSRTPVLIGQASSHSSPGRDSPRTLPIAATAVHKANMPGMSTEARTPLGLSGGLGFFSGADSHLWAPSPKSQTPGVGPSNLLLSTGSQSRQLDRFSFDARPEPQSDPAAAWASAAKQEADKSAQQQQQQVQSHTLASSSYLSASGMHTHTASLLLMDDSKIHSPHADAAASLRENMPPVLLPAAGSPSPDSVLPATVANTLWTSPIASQAATEESVSAQPQSSPLASFPDATMLLQRQLASHLQCSVRSTDSAAPAHTLSAPVSTPCCGVALCKECVGAYLTAGHSRMIEAAAKENELKRPEQTAPRSTPTIDTGAGAVALCQCGNELTEEDAQRLRDAPANRALQQLAAWLRQLESGSGGVIGGVAVDNESVQSSSSPPVVQRPSHSGDKIRVVTQLQPQSQAHQSTSL